MLWSTPLILCGFSFIDFCFIFWFFFFLVIEVCYSKHLKNARTAKAIQIWQFKSSKTSIWDTFVFRRSPSSTSSTLAPSPKHRILDFFDGKWVIFDGNLCFLRMISLFGWNAHMLCAFWPGCHYSAHTPDRIPPTRPASQPCRPCQPCQLFHCIQPFLWP